MTNTHFIDALRENSTWVAVGSGLRKFTMIVLLAVLCACSSSTEQLPNGAVLSISPPERTLDVFDRSDEQGRCQIDPTYYIDWPIVLQLSNAEGSPIGEQNIRVYLDYGANTFGGYPVMELYDDRRGNGNGLVDEFELVSGADDEIAIVMTDKFGGDRELLVRMNLSCPYRGEIFAFVQGVTASTTINIVARPEGENDQSTMENL